MEELRLMKELRELTIDPEFRDLIPPLAEEERRILEESIVANGCESPLTIWNDTIVDGHNRYDICRKHSIPFAVLEKDFADRDAALLWMIQTQLGRRNLTAYQKSELALRFEPLMSKQLTLGSLFDGIGGFPLAGMLSGIKPIWASEIEPFPVRVTAVRFPDMKHYGDIHSLNGGELEPVDIITFGSPCQNLSLAGARTGLAGEQSSLFFEAVRVIREMREKTNGTYPRWAVWENVPGALSSTGGDDFRVVLESLVQIKDPQATVPMPETGKWLSAGEIQGCASALGDTYSLAWRIIDAAKGWGVAQRRRRIFAVLDLDGQCAGKVLFESEGVSGYTPPRGQARQGTAGSAQAGVGETGGEGSAVAVEFNPTDSRIKINKDGICQTLTNRMGTGGNQVPLTLKIRSGCEGGGKGPIWQVDSSATLGCNNDQTLFVPKAYGISSDQSNAMLSGNPHSGIYEADTSRTLDCSGGSPACNQGGIAVVQPIAFAQNQRDEVRDLGGQSGALAASPGMKQQTYVAAFMGGQGVRAGGLGYREEQSPTLKAAPSGGNTVPDVVYALQGNMIGRKDENGPQGTGINEEVCFTLNTIDRPAVATPSYSARTLINTEIQEEVTPALMARDFKDPVMVSKPSNETQPAYSLDRAAFNQGENALFGISVEEEQSQTLTAQGPNAVAKPEDVDYLVRRLTPGECCRLQGYPDGWTENLGTEEPTDAELRWWAGVFEDWYRAQGKNAKPPSEARLRKWLKDPRTDAAEYKALGNSVAIPCVFFVLAGIVWAAETEAEHAAQ